MNTEDIREDVELGIDAVTLEIPLRVTMISYDNIPFEFTSSIDEVGQIILTPLNKNVEFVDVNTSVNVEFDTPIMEQDTITSVDGAITTRQTSILIHANMLAEDSNLDVSADIDEIGQVVIYPLKKENIFVTASFEESLNLVTEDLQTIDYFGYKLVNNGDGWDVYDPTNELVDEGVATEAEAKILVCTTEIHRLEQLTESVEESNNEDAQPEQTDEEKVSEITADVVEDLSTEDERELDVVTRFLQGNIGLFSDSGKIPDSYIHLDKLDANGYCYYYDPESDCVVSYPDKRK